MKQMMKDAKKNSFRELLKFILFCGLAGAAVLIYQSNAFMQILGLKPQVDEIARDEVLILCLLGTAGVIFALYLLIRVVSGNCQQKLKADFAKLGKEAEGKIVFDYENAWKANRTLRVGSLFTYDFGDVSRAYLNSNIVWMHEFYEKGNCYIRIYFLNEDKPAYLDATKDTYAEIMEYYQNHFPHIVVGYSDELSKLYFNDRKQFLSLRYYNSQNNMM